MLSFFAPAYIKEARLVSKNARKLLHYKQDVLSEKNLAEFQAAIGRLDQAIRDRDRPAVEAAAQELDKQWSRYLPPAKDAAWRENCEVFLVAIVIAIGVRTYFLQPFTIPTGSMQPTLNGIIGHPSQEPPPGILVRAVDFVLRGRNYINVVAKSDDIVVRMGERKMLYFFTLTDVQCSHSSYTIWAPMETLVRYFNVRPPTPYSAGTQYSAGDIIARGWIDAGDHVFVDKVSYNLHMPHRGEVFVFSTRGILGIDLDRLLRQQGVDPPTAQLLLSIERQLRQQAVEQPPPSSAAQILLRVEIERLLRQQGVEGSEFYIKRLAGLPLDNLRVASPLLYVNGHLAQEFGFQRVMNDKIPDYDRGYTNPSPVDAWHLTSPDATYTVPAGHYFAMGDNSANSLDGRYWGPVPQENLMGRGLFVYWPFLPHWGLVR